jgi:20S proteasome alpha/beta subunit
MKRNVYTGDSFDIATITVDKGYMELPEKEKKNLLEKPPAKTIADLSNTLSAAQC